MVRLTRAGEYGIHGMIHLARRSGDGAVRISEIARAQNVSASFLAKVFQGLRKAGLVTSQRGVGGGVMLGRPADRITLREIVEAIEGPVAINRCLLPEDPCEHAATCPVAEVWRRAQGRMLEVLEGVTLAQLSAGGLAS